MDNFDVLAAERQSLADVLDSLSDQDWTTPSCCVNWTVEDVVAHLTVVWNYSALDYVRRSFRTRGTWFRPSAALVAINQRTVDERKAAGRHALIADIRAHVDDRTSPTGFGIEAPLTDLVVHRRDIRLPLGRLDSEVPEHARAALDTATKRQFGLFSTRSALTGLAFAATDLDWSYGSGPDITGSAHALAHAMWGRPASLDELTGPGVDTLRARLQA